jgi:hypothetical protein
LNGFQVTVAELDRAVRCPDVADPVAVLAEHRYEVPSVIEPGFYERERPWSA